MPKVAIELEIEDARWLHRWLQDEYRREGFRPHEPRKPQVLTVGAVVELAVEAHDSGQEL